MYLDAEEVLRAINEAMQGRVTGAAIYDALLIACARKINAEQILTFNIRDFHRIAPDLADIIREP